EHLADLVRDVVDAATAALEAFLGTGRGLARLAHGVERRTGVAVGFGLPVLGLGQAVGGLAARGLGALDLAHQPPALLLEARRGVLELGALAAGLGHAGLERAALPGRAVAAAGPAVALGADRREPALGELGLVRQRLRLAAQIRERCPLLLDLAAHRGELA